MRDKSLFIASMAASLLLTGCMQPMRTKTVTGMHPDVISVTVRFKMPPEPKQFVTSHSEFGTKLVLDPMYDGFVDSGQSTDNNTESDIVHVALWGSGYNGFDVTHRATPLAPGSYTFAFLDPDYTTAIQGWVSVNDTSENMIHFLKKWVDRIPEQKQWIAYDLELQNRLDGNDASVFKSFAEQLRAFDRLERQLNKAIMHETREQARSMIQNNDFLNSAEVLILPGGNGFFHPTTRAAFTKNDLTRVRSGETMSKMLLVADYDSAQWKLKRINHIRNELIRCKNVLMQEADRLERRKRLLVLTDHLYNHDRKFVDNEMRLQQTLASIDRINEQLSDLRERRTAMAFISELVAPNHSFRPLDDEQRDLMKERVVFETRKNQLNLLFNETSPKSSRRVVLERKRQDVIRAMEGIDNQLNHLAEARVALRTLRRTSDVIHRQGQRRMLTASFVDQRIPFHVREAIEREALMTIRLQATDSMFVPTRTSAAQLTAHGSMLGHSGTPVNVKDQLEIAARLAHAQTQTQASMIHSQMLTDDAEFNHRRTLLAQAYNRQAQFQAQVEAQERAEKEKLEKELQARFARQAVEAEKAQREAMKLAQAESKIRQQRERERTAIAEREANQRAQQELQDRIQRQQEEQQSRMLQREQQERQARIQREQEERQARIQRKQDSRQARLVAERRVSDLDKIRQENERRERIAQREANQRAIDREFSRRDREIALRDRQVARRDRDRQDRDAELEAQRISLAESRARRAWERAEARAAERDSQRNDRDKTKNSRWSSRHSDERRERRGQLVNQREQNRRKENKRWESDRGSYYDRAGHKNQDDVECDIPLLIRILVPPCWFSQN